MFQIEKGIPLPTQGQEYPFRDMDVGDSFYAPPTGNAPQKAANRISTGAALFRKRTGIVFKFCCRTDEAGGVRCWRIA